MDNSILTIPAAFSKEADHEYQRFLILMDRFQMEMSRLEMAMIDLKIGGGEVKINSCLVL